MTDDLFYFDEDKAALSSSLTLTGGGSLNMMGSAMPSAKPLLFDVSWEVCRYDISRISVLISILHIIYYIPQLNTQIAHQQRW